MSDSDSEVESWEDARREIRHLKRFLRGHLSQDHFETASDYLKDLKDDLQDLRDDSEHFRCKYKKIDQWGRLLTLGLIVGSVFAAAAGVRSLSNNDVANGFHHMVSSFFMLNHLKIAAQARKLVGNIAGDVRLLRKSIKHTYKYFFVRKSHYGEGLLLVIAMLYVCAIYWWFLNHLDTVNEVYISVFLIVFFAIFPWLLQFV